jgi:hypothetical protein
VDAASETAGDKFRSAARAVVETPAQAEAYAERVKLPPALKTAAVDSVVELCRENNLNLGPGWALGGIAVEWLAAQGFDPEEMKMVGKGQFVARVAGRVETTSGNEPKKSSTVSVASIR